MFKVEVIEEIKKADEIVIDAIDRYLRRMIVESVREIQHDLGRTISGNSELRRELHVLKEVKKEMEKHPNAVLTLDFMNKYFSSYHFLPQYFIDYEHKIEDQFEEIKKLNFISELSEVVNGEKKLGSIAPKARLVLKNGSDRLFDSAYGPLLIGDFYDQIPSEELQELKTNIELLGPKNCHTLSGICAKYLKADICTGYVNSQIPNLRVIHSWLEKDDYCYDVNTGIYMRKEDYERFYQPEYVNRLDYHDLNGLETMVEDGVSYVCYAAYQNILQEKEPKLLYKR